LQLILYLCRKELNEIKLFLASSTRQYSFSTPALLNRIFVYPNKSVVPDNLVCDFFFNFGGRVIYLLPIGNFTTVELGKC